MTDNFIVDHAIANVWCEPSQDTEIIIEPKRITPSPGVVGKYEVMWTVVDLPDISSRWHIYQIGQIHPLILGLFPQTNAWTSFAQSCNSQNMICDIYTATGINLPRFDTYYLYNEDRVLVIAVKENTNFSYDFNNDTIYLRVYSNAFFNSTIARAANDFIYIQGITAKFASDVLALQTAQATYAAMPGTTYGFVNGVFVDSIDLITMKTGDTAEFIYDSSIYKVVNLPVSSLQTFTSTLDSKIKYLLHYSGSDANQIDYQDDIDVFLLQQKTNSRTVGLYYNKNNQDAMRNLTHRDYSIVPQYVVDYSPTMQTVSALPTPVNPNNWTVRLHIRKSGFNRPLVFENNRINELYKLTDAQIVGAMVGVNATVSVWQAANLEASGYTQLMRSDYAQVTPSLVQSAYGYNAIAKAIGDNPSLTYVNSTQVVANVPFRYSQNSTAYEYDSNGYLLGWYTHALGSVYACTNSTAHFVEFIPGTGSQALDEYYGFTTLNISASENIRVYTCPIVGGLPTNIFTDVTANTLLYSRVGNTVTWLSTDATIYPMLRTDSKFLAYDLSLGLSSSLLEFDITSIQTRASTTANWIMQVPSGQFDLFLNGKSLINGLDYVIKFPKVIITNKEYLNSVLTTSQNLHIRFVGFCDSALSMDVPTDTGFIKYGLMSENHAFDLRDDRVLRIVLNGGLKSRSQITFAENTPGITFSGAINGQPYQIRDMIVPLDELVPGETYAQRALSQVIDVAVSNYMSLALPQPPDAGPDQITTPYQVFSPFISALILDISTGELVIPTIVGIYGRTYVSQICQHYEWILPYDPIRNIDAVNTDYVAIHPHLLYTVVNVTFAGYKFLQEVVTYYGNGLVNLSPFVSIS